MNYIQLTVPISLPFQMELLIAELSVIGFEGFEENENELKAFITTENFNESELNLIFQQYKLTYSKSTIIEQNWNQLWESNFDPVIVDDFVAVRAGFHHSIQNVEHEILITPKMSFGTGHHATTFMMMQLMRQIDFRGKAVYDFGTGTGILAILAEKLGAKSVTAVDNDTWCIDNATENVLNNNCNFITIQQVENADSRFSSDVILANINKNIIIENIPYLAANIENGGILLLSGLLKEDEPEMLCITAKTGWTHLKTIEKGAWIAMMLRS